MKRGGGGGNSNKVADIAWSQFDSGGGVGREQNVEEEEKEFSDEELKSKIRTLKIAKG